MQENKNLERIRKRFSEHDIFCSVCEPMCRRTSFQIGGPADWFVCPENREQLKTAAEIIREENIPWFVLGNGSNLLVSDKGIRGVVLHPVFNRMEANGTTITCGSGVLLSRVARFAAQNGLCGLAFASGIPGSIGGAVRMNAGAYGGEMAAVVQKTEYLNLKTMTMETVEKEQHDFSYRHSVFCESDEKIICETVLSLVPGKREKILEDMDELAKRRREKQPVSMPSAGSVFKRPKGYYAAELIDRAGLRGCSVGGAQVSEKHTGFIVNTGGATAEDVRNLIEKVREEVQEQFGVLLECEVCIIGE